MRVLVLAAITVLGCSTPLASSPTAVGGRLDLRDRDLSEIIAPLDGEWGFAGSAFLDPADAQTEELADVPGRWSLGGEGYATYRLEVLVDEDTTDLGISMHGAMTACRLYVNGELVTSDGQVTTSAAEAQAARTPRIVPVSASHGVLVLVMHVSNYGYRRGGLHAMELGSTRTFHARRTRGLGFDLVVFGALAIMFLYHLGLFALRRRDPSPFYFALFCGLMAIRALINGESYLLLLFPDLSYEVYLELEYLTVYLGVPVFTTFFASVFPDEMPKRGLRVMQWAGVLFAALVLATPETIYGNSYRVFHGVLLLSLLFVTWRLLLALKARREGATLFVAGFAVFFAAAVHDILMQNGLFQGVFLSSVGFFAFIMTQAFMLSRRFSRAYAESLRIKANLEDLVEERTRNLSDALVDLADANQSLENMSRIDELTKVANRRAFDAELDRAWRRAIRDRTPVSLLMIDVDHFKRVNDTHGHVVGDMFLREVGAALACQVKRPDDTVARYGGEEFAVVLQNTPITGATHVAELIRRAIAAVRVDTDVGSVGVTASIGVACQIPIQDRLAPGELVVAADKALYEAKHKGRDQVRATDLRG